MWEEAVVGSSGRGIWGAVPLEGGAAGRMGSGIVGGVVSERMISMSMREVTLVLWEGPGRRGEGQEGGVVKLLSSKLALLRYTMKVI